LLGLLPAALAHADDDADTEERTRMAFAVTVNGIVPLAGYADRQIGAGVEGGIGALFDRMLVLGTVGIRHAVTNDDDTFTHVPFEASFCYLLAGGDSAPLLGGGVGLHYLFEQVYFQRSVGDVLRSTSTDVIEDSEAGATLFARAGVLLGRTHLASWMISVDFAVTFAEFEERSSEHALRLNFGALLGGH
jgi:hypothetical protein